MHLIPFPLTNEDSSSQGYSPPAQTAPALPPVPKSPNITQLEVPNCVYSIISFIPAIERMWYFWKYLGNNNTAKLTLFPQGNWDQTDVEKHEEQVYLLSRLSSTFFSSNGSCILLYYKLHDPDVIIKLEIT